MGKYNLFCSTKRIVAVLACISLLATGCSKKSEVDDLEKENSRLRSELSASGAKTEEKLSEAKKSIDDLQAQVDAFKNSQATIEDLTQQIAEKNEVKKGLEDALKTLEEQKSQANKDLEQATKSAQDLTSGAEAKKQEAEAMMADATKRIGEIEVEEARLAALKVQLDERQRRLEIAVNEWKEIYSKHKLDAVFDKLIDEKKSDATFTFQFGVVGLNVSAEDITKMRASIEKMTRAESNPYRNDLAQSPWQSVIKTLTDAKAKGASQTGITVTGVWSNLVASQGRELLMNDSYMIRTNATSLIALRDELKSFNRSGTAVYMVPRLIEKLSVSLALNVTVNNSKDDALVKEYVTTIKANIGQPVEVPVDLSKEIDVTRPMASLFPSDKCQVFDANCLKEIKSRGYLNKTVTLNGVNRPLIQVLREQLLDSSNQMLVYIQEANDGRMVYSLTDRVLMNFIDPKKMCRQDDWSEFECSPETEKPNKRKPTIEKLELAFSVNMIQEMPSTGMIPIDLAVANDFKALALRMANGKVHIGLPINSARTSSLVVDELAKEKVVGVYGPMPVGRQHLLQNVLHMLSSKNHIYTDMVGALR